MTGFKQAYTVEKTSGGEHYMSLCLSSWQMYNI